MVTSYLLIFQLVLSKSDWNGLPTFDRPTQQEFADLDSCMRVLNGVTINSPESRIISGCIKVERK